jgi:energy-coupling factor transporter transmembrane protein EcfT/uncharacterized membrane protein
MSASDKTTGKNNARQGNVQRLARVSLLAAVALILSYIETMIPLPVALPGVKLGLANIAVVVALFAIDTRTAFAVALVKVFASGFLFGSPMMLAYSAGGMALAFAVMALMKLIPGISVVVVSMASAIFHNVGQIAVACLVLSSPAVFLSLPPLAVAALVTGALTGAVALGVLASIAPQASGGQAAKSSALAKLAAAGRKPSRAEWEQATCSARCSSERYDAGSTEQQACSAKEKSRRQASGSAGGSTGHSAEYSVRQSVRATKPKKQRRTGGSATGFGVYRAGATFAHKLDPRTKLLFTALFFVAAFAAQDVLGLGIVTAATVVALAASGIGPGQGLRLLRPFLWLLLFVVAWDVLFVNKGEVLVQAGPVCVSVGGIAFAVESGVRFCCMMLGTGALMRTTSPTELTDGIALALRPLARLGAQVDDAALALGLTFRFIPTLAQEYGRIKQAQKSRLASFSGGVVQRLAAYGTVFTPLFANALRRADRVATGIESRAFGANARSCIREYRFAAADALALAASVALVVSAFLI